jgi:hypothetical protein
VVGTPAGIPIAHPSPGVWYVIAKQPAQAPHLPSRCATYCNPCRPLLRAVSGWILSPPLHSSQTYPHPQPAPTPPNPPPP